MTSRRSRVVEDFGEAIRSAGSHDEVEGIREDAFEHGRFLLHGEGQPALTENERKHLGRAGAVLVSSRAGMDYCPSVLGID